MNKNDFDLIKNILQKYIDIKKQMMSEFSTQFLLTDNDCYKTWVNELTKEIKTIEETLIKLY